MGLRASGCRGKQSSKDAVPGDKPLECDQIVSKSPNKKNTRIRVDLKLRSSCKKIEGRIRSSNWGQGDNFIRDIQTLSLTFELPINFAAHAFDFFHEARGRKNYASKSAGVNMLRT